MPVLARVYHVPPDRQRRLRLADFNALIADYEALRRAEEPHGD